MTISCERMNALRSARDFLRDLLDPKKTPRVPKAIRTEAYYRLKHYPMDYHLDMIEEVLPVEFGPDILYSKTRKKK